MKILLISLAGIGDTILATPLIRELRANFPDARIDALVLWPGSRDILEGNPHLNRVFQRNLMLESKPESLRYLRQLGREGYDVSINTHPQSKIHYRFTAWLIGARLRLSHRYERSGLLDAVFVNRLLPQDYSRHTVEQNLDFLKELGTAPRFRDHRLELCLSPAEAQWARDYLDASGLRGRPVLGVHTGSGGTKNLALKRWPLGNYIDLLRQLTRDRPDLSVLLFGGPEEAADARRVIEVLGCPRVLRAGSRSLREAAALIRECDAFLSVDTALMHVAAAVGARRQHVIEAPTFNRTNEPCGNPYTLIRNPAVAGRNLEYYRYDGLGIKGTREELMRCMESVSVDSVLQVLKAALASE